MRKGPGRHLVRCKFYLRWHNIILLPNTSIRLFTADVGDIQESIKGNRNGSDSSVDILQQVRHVLVLKVI